MSTSQNGVFFRTQHDLKKELRLSKSFSLNHVCVCNGEMLSSVTSNVVLHISVAHTQHTSEKPSEIQLPILGSDSIAHLHLSPSGRHAIVSMKSGENFHINVKMNSYMNIKKIRGIITAVGWHPDLSLLDTGHILLGTEKGGILETSITSKGEVVFVKEHVACLGSGDRDPAAAPIAISQIFIAFCNDDDVTTKASKWALLICLADRLYALTATIDTTVRTAVSSFVASSSLQSGWMPVMPEQPPPTHYQSFFSQKELFCLHAHSGWKTSVAGLSLFPDSRDSRFLKFLWLTADGYTLGTVDLAADNSRELIKEDQHLDHQRVDGKVDCPLAVSLSEYHVLLLYSNRLKAVSFHTHNVVYDDAWSKELGLGLGLTYDATSHFHWLFTTTSCVLKYRPNDESRYVWKVFLDAGDYARALAVARERQIIEPQAYELVLSKQAAKYIAEKNFAAAAEILAQSTEPFETVLLRFLSAPPEDAERARTGLKTLLDKKIEQLNAKQGEPGSKTKRDALFMWLLEIQLSELAELRKQAASSITKASAEGGDIEEKLKELTRQMHSLLLRKNVQDSLKTLKNAIYRLMVSHADFDSQLFVATALNDLDTVVSIRLGREQHLEALNTILNSPGSAGGSSSFAFDLLAKHASRLADRVPSEFFSALHRLRGVVAPLRFLPLLSQTNSREVAIHSIPFLEKLLNTAVSGVEPLHNLLLSLYARFDPSSLLPYLKSSGRDKTTLPYDLEYAIRTCQKHRGESQAKRLELESLDPNSDEAEQLRDSVDRLTCCIVRLFCIADMLTEAVELALTEMKDVSLAKECVRWGAEEDEWGAGGDGLLPAMGGAFLNGDGLRGQSRKPLWLRITRFIMHEGGGDASKCIELLKESNDVIKIQDIFPLFPDFTKIGQFKEPLLKCLKEHSESISRLQGDMKQATQTAHEIRDQIDKLRKRVQTIRVSDICSSCKKTLCTRPFYAHACRHFFHRDCLEREMAPFLSQESQSRLNELVEREKRLLTELQYLDRQSEKSSTIAERESLALQLQQQISSVLAAECPFCSNIAIDQIDKPFFSDEEFAREIDDWDI